MSVVIKSELLKLIESDDLHGAMLLVNRAWLGKYHPEAGRASLIVPFGPDEAMLRYPIIPACEAACDAVESPLVLPL